MNELYTKLFNLRDSIKEDSQKDKNRLDALGKILVIAFDHKDELPESFYLTKVFLEPAELESIFASLEIDAKVELKNDAYMSGCLYKVTLQ